MISKRASFLAVLVLSVSAVAADKPAKVAKDKPAKAAADKPANSDALPLSTKSVEARHLMEKAWVLEADQVEQVKGLAVMRKIVHVDPHFALAHQILAQTSTEPAEQVKEQQAAVANKHYASPAEQTVIDWFQDAADHKLIPAITSMNSVLNQYPHDKWLVFLANSWLTAQTQYERAAAVYERSGIIDSPGLINNAAYTYAHMRQFDKAFVLMDKYVALLPKDANPQDSYGELLRLAGRFDQSLDHYRAALAIDPKFYWSQFGLADTYSLMGDEARARMEYEVGFRKFQPQPSDWVMFKTREAMTYVREGDFKGADAAFQEIADYTHNQQMGQAEADTYRQMALYQTDSKRALYFLGQAEIAIHEGTNAMRANIQQETAQILRARLEIALKMGDKAAATAALADLATLSGDSDDKMIESAYQGAAGAVAYASYNYGEAISHLEEDTDSPTSLRLLAAAYRKTEDGTSEKRVDGVLANVNDMTLEQAMIVPAFRKCLKKPNCDAGFRNASVKQ